MQNGREAIHTSMPTVELYLSEQFFQQSHEWLPIHV